MRPLNLSMSAFGPYSKTENIDFGELQARNLFLITGPTGAGKTTIFDALSYALFGKASGEFRSEESLRSHFASSDLLTSVALTFELRGMIYHIHRQPRQERPKKRGEGTIIELAKATLTIEDGEPRTVIEGVSYVNEKIESVLGINERQFKQIMMIPQGEFRKLLVADSKDREKVLRQLFDTNIYRRIQTELDERSKKLYKEIKNQHAKIQGMLSGIKIHDNESLQSLLEEEHSPVEQILEGVREQITTDKYEQRRLSKAVEEADNAINAQISKKKEAETDNNNIRQVKELTDQLTDHQSKKQRIDVKKAALDQAVSAARLIPTEQNMLARKKHQEDLIRRISEREALFKEKTLALDAAKSQLEVVQKETFLNVLEEEKSTHMRLSALIEKVDELGHLRTSQLDVIKSLENTDSHIDKNTAEKEKMTLELSQIQERFKDLSDAPVALEQRKTALDKAMRHRERLDDFNEIYKTLLKDEQRLETELTSLSQMEKASQKKDRAYKKAKMIFLQNQAAIIAAELEENLPCPVCGSLDHPHPAVAIEKIISRETLEEMEQQLQAETNRYNTANMAYTRHRSTYDTHYQSLVSQVEALWTDFTYSDDVSLSIIGEHLSQMHRQSADDLDSLHVAVTEATKDLEKYNALEKRIDQLQKLMMKLESETFGLIDRKNALIQKATELTTTIELIIKEVPEEVRDSKALTETLSQLATAIDEKTKAIQSAHQHYESVKDTHIQLKAELEQLKKNLDDLQVEIQALQSDYIDKLASAGFPSEEAYQSAKLTQEEVELLRSEQKDYHEQLIRLQTILRDLELRTCDKTMVDISEIDQILDELQASRNEQMDLLGVVTSRVKDNDDIRRRVKASNDRIRDKSDQYSIIGNLARVAQGNNRSMMTFERFVLARFFEDIITAANIRLKQMTQNRYELLRSEDVYHKSRQSGLELNVIDHFTGKPRHVKTLSGGESFKASLAMALGLSDVVQSYAGGVRLDTMFIDEGFGTLDQDSLDSAINCLVDLQNTGRLVGIISHVQELKERIDARLEVKGTSLGSECSFVIG